MSSLKHWLENFKTQCLTSQVASNETGPGIQRHRRQKLNQIYPCDAKDCKDYKDKKKLSMLLSFFYG